MSTERKTQLTLILILTLVSACGSVNTQPRQQAQPILHDVQEKPVASSEQKQPTLGNSFSAQIIYATVPIFAQIRRDTHASAKTRNEKAPGGMKWLYLSVELTAQPQFPNLLVPDIKILADEARAYPPLGIGDGTLFDLFATIDGKDVVAIAQPETVQKGRVTFDLAVSRSEKTGEVALVFQNKQTVNTGLLFAIPVEAKQLSLQLGEGPRVPVTIGHGTGTEHVRRNIPNKVVTSTQAQESEAQDKVSVLFTSSPQSVRIRHGRSLPFTIKDETAPQGNRWLYVSIRWGSSEKQKSIPATQIVLVNKKGSTYPALGLGNSDLFDLFENLDSSHGFICGLSDRGDLGVGMYLEKEGPSMGLMNDIQNAKTGILFAVPTDASPLSLRLGSLRPVVIQEGRGTEGKHPGGWMNGVINFR